MMTEREANLFIANYRVLFKRWTMVVAGVVDGDSDDLLRQLDEGRDELTAIAARFPEKAYTVDVLINARSRSSYDRA
jgi:hypothetical protein